MTIEREVYAWIYQDGEYPGRYKIAKYLNMMVDRWYEDTGDGMDILASADLDRVGDVLLALNGVRNAQVNFNDDGSFTVDVKENS